MPRDLILNSFAGGVGSRAGCLCPWLELDLLMPGEEHHGDLTPSAPHDVAEGVAIDVVEPQENAIRWTFARIDDHERARAFHVTHVARKRRGPPLYPYSSPLHVRVVFNMYQLSIYHLIEPINVCLSAIACDL